MWICKTIPDIPCVSQIHGGPSLRRGDTKEGLNNHSGIRWGGKDTGRLVTWEFPLRTDSASWKSLESFIQFTSFCNSCTLPDNSKIVFWSSMSFRLASVSKVELWNFRNSSISVRFVDELHEIPFAVAIILLSSFPDLSTTFSVWVFSENLL